MLLMVEVSWGHHGCMDCRRIFDTGEYVLIDRHGGPWALACVDREACKERQIQREAEPLYRGAPVSCPAPAFRAFLAASLLLCLSAPAWAASTPRDRGKDLRGPVKTQPVKPPPRQGRGWCAEVQRG